MSKKMKISSIQAMEIKTPDGYQVMDLSDLVVQDSSNALKSRFAEIETTLDATVKIPQLNNYYTKGDINRLLWKHGGKR